MRQWLKQKKLRVVLAAGLVSTGALAATATVASSGASAQSNVTLTMESSPVNTLTQTYNPFNNTSSIYLVGGASFIYEPLLQFDAAKAGVIYPWLATKYAFSDGGKKVTFTVRQGVKWSNGTPMTAADVAFTYELEKANPSIDLWGLDITGVSTSGNNVTISFPTAQYTNLQNIASVYIVPKSIWSTVGNPSTYADATPIGTGPYVVGTFTPQGLTLTKNPSYWQASKVKIQTLDFPAYSSNTTAEEALFAGQLDWAGNFIPNLKSLFLNKYRGSTAWEAPLNTVTLEPNLNRFPLNELAVRKAISLAVNRDAISKQGEATLEPPATNASGITLPEFNAYLSPSVGGDTLSGAADPGAAKALLQKAGWTLKGGYFYKGGKELAFTIDDPSNYTDYAADATIIASDLRKAGMNVSFNGMSDTGWTTAVATGNFDSIIHWSNTGTNPFTMYDAWLDSAYDTSSATGDYEHLHDRAINSELKKVATAPNLAAEKAALAPVEEYMASNMPLIPLVYGVAWSEVNTSSTTGWPTPSNPYESAQPASPTNEVVVLHLSPRS